MPSYRPAAIANVFLDLAAQEGRWLSNMQVQKMVYFAHGWHLASDLGPLSSEPAEAWLYGPVFPSLYHLLKRWGGMRIAERIGVSQRVEDPISQAVIRGTWESCKDLSAMQLSAQTHDSSGPWYRRRVETGGDRFVEIPDALVKQYFVRLRNANSAAAH